MWWSNFGKVKSDLVLWTSKRKTGGTILLIDFCFCLVFYYNRDDIWIDVESMGLVLSWVFFCMIRVNSLETHIYLCIYMCVYVIYVLLCGGYLTFYNRFVDVLVEEGLLIEGRKNTIQRWPLSKKFEKKRPDFTSKVGWNKNIMHTQILNSNYQ